MRLFSKFLLILFFTGCAANQNLVTKTDITKNYGFGVPKTIFTGDHLASVARVTSKFIDGYYNDIPVSVERFTVRLTYLGMEGSSVIKLHYREFGGGDQARPVFDLDLEYNLEDSRLIVFRDLKFSVSEASNSSLTYTIISDTPNSIFP